MHRAQQRDAVRQQKFFFRRSIYPNDVIPHDHSHKTPTESVAHTPAQSVSPPASPTHATSINHNPLADLSSPDGIDALSPNGVEHVERAYTASSGRQSPDPASFSKNEASNEETDPILPASSSPASPSKSTTNGGKREAPNSSASQTRCPSPVLPALGSVDDEYEEMTIAEIINGKGEGFPGLLGVVNTYLNTLNVEFASKKRMRTYLNLIKWRADGMLLSLSSRLQSSRFLTLLFS